MTLDELKDELDRYYGVYDDYEVGGIGISVDHTNRTIKLQLEPKPVKNKFTPLPDFDNHGFGRY